MYKDTAGLFLMRTPQICFKTCSYRLQCLRDSTSVNRYSVSSAVFVLQWKPVIRTSSGVEKNVLITGMFL